MSEPEITLTCWVIGEGFENIFTVDVSPGSRVSRLKSLIWNLRQPEFSYFSYPRLTLVKIDIPARDFDFTPDDIKSLMDSTGAQSPLGFQTISELFNNEPPPRDHVHIVVQSPLSTPRLFLTGYDAYLPFNADDDIMNTLWKSHDKTIEGTLGGKSPSVNAKSTNYRLYQDQDIPIHDGRYGKCTRFTLALPIELYHPVFAEFKANISNESIQVPQDIIHQTAKIMVDTSQIQEKGFRRTRPTRLLMAELVCHGLVQNVNFDRSSAYHIAFSIRLLSPAEASVAIIEEKSELGSSGDASVQCSFSYLNFWSQSDVCCTSPSLFNLDSLTI